MNTQFRMKESIIICRCRNYSDISDKAVCNVAAFNVVSRYLSTEGRINFLQLIEWKNSTSFLTFKIINLFLSLDNSETISDDPS